MNETDENGSSVEAIINQFSSNQKAISNPVVYALLVIFYSLEVVVGVAGNLLVIIAVGRKKQMQTPRNIFILNLAVSDLLFCLTVPLTVMDAMTSRWPLDNSQLPCLVLKTLPCVAVIMSSLTIVVIAADRYRVIVHSSSKQCSVLGAWIALPVILLLSIFLSSPLLFAAKLESLDVLLDWTFGLRSRTSKHDRLWFTLYSSGIQFVLPFVIISIIYNRIYVFLRNNRLQQTSVTQKQRKTNNILMAIAIIFFISWLPFSCFCILTEVFDIFDSTETLMLVYCICHLIGISSSCTNPILYAFLNDNFLKEFRQILPCLNKDAYRKFTQNVRERYVNALTALNGETEEVHAPATRATSETSIIVAKLTGYKRRRPAVEPNSTSEIQQQFKGELCLHCCEEITKENILSSRCSVLQETNV